MITFTLSTFNTLNYLKLAIHSVRKNSYYKDAPFVIHAENCTDGTNEWLEENKEKYNLEVYIEQNEIPKGIGGGMNFCASKVKTKYIKSKVLKKKKILTDIVFKYYKMSESEGFYVSLLG
jgi:hypothetical protein